MWVSLLVLWLRYQGKLGEHRAWGPGDKAERLRVKWGMFTGCLFSLFGYYALAMKLLFHTMTGSRSPS